MKCTVTITTTSAPDTGETTEATTDTDTATGTVGEVSAEHNDADILFAQMMIPHHQQAVEVSDLLLTMDDIPADLTEFTQGVIDTQGTDVARFYLEQGSAVTRALSTWPAMERRLNES